MNHQDGEIKNVAGVHRPLIMFTIRALFCILQKSAHRERNNTRSYNRKYRLDNGVEFFS